MSKFGDTTVPTSYNRPCAKDPQFLRKYSTILPPPPNSSLSLPICGNPQSSPIRRPINYTSESTFHGCSTLHELFFHGPNNDGGSNKPCLGYRASTSTAGSTPGSTSTSTSTSPPSYTFTFTPYIYQSYSEVKGRVCAFAQGLETLHLVSPTNMLPGMPLKTNESCNIPLIAIYSSNSPEWLITEQAVYSLGGATVPLYDTLGSDALEHILRETEVGVIVCGSGKEVESVLRVKARGKIGNLKFLIVNDPCGNNHDLATLASKGVLEGVTVTSFAKVEATGRTRLTNNYNNNKSNKSNSRSSSQFSPPTQSSIATFCYTSGTTGPPKGALISHGNLLSLISSLEKCGLLLTSADRHLSYLPLTHIFERVVTLGILGTGGSIGFISGGPERLVEDWVAVRPTIVPVAPRVLNKMYDKITNGIAAAGGVKKMLFDKALSSKLRNLKQTGELKSSLWDGLLFNKIKTALGLNQVRLMVSGSAPLSPEVMSFFRVLIGSPVVEGYGQTEGTGGATVGDLTDMDSVGHVGGPIPCVEIKLVDVPEMEYLNSDKSHGAGGIVCEGRGEIWLRGPTVFRGYYKDVAKTVECLTSDGWLKSGDIGLWRTDGQLQIIDRKKNIFKLSQGEYVAAEKIENVLLLSPFIEQVFVYGDSLQSWLVCVVVLEAEYLKSWQAKNIKTGAAKGGLWAAVLQDVLRTSHLAKLNSFEIVRNVHLETSPFTAENGLLTPTFKLKRHELKKKYQPNIDEMYRSGKSKL